MIVLGYPGIGKTTICKDCQKYIDLESSYFAIDGKKFDHWETVYCNLLMYLSDKYIVFGSTHKLVLDFIMNNKTTKCIIYPSLELKDEWVHKLKTRYFTDPSIKNM